MTEQSESATSVEQSQRADPLIKRVMEAQRREKDFIVSEIVKIRGLMPLLMKSRNGIRWDRAEKRKLIEQIRALSHLSPYLVLLLLPGSVLMLPIMAWWLDRRRQRRKTPETKDS